MTVRIPALLLAATLVVGGIGVVPASASVDAGTPSSTARSICSSTRALVTRTDELAARLADPAPDGVDRAALRRRLAAAFRRTGRAAEEGAAFLDHTAPRDRALARTERAAARSLATSARTAAGAARRVEGYPILDRDDWNAAVVRLRERSTIRGGRAALEDLRAAVRRTPRGRAVIAAARSDVACAGSLTAD